ncbi:MAG TPA: ABC transporter ATP-binding protein [Gammaproteobacteria bacterium]|nr:ABC transporter ATP-binding protein [Gammaproteobacteria bacterium]
MPRQGRPHARTPAAWRRSDVLTASLASNLLALALPLVTLQVYDRIIPNASFPTLAVLVSALVVVALGDALLSHARAAILAHRGAHYEYHSGMQAMDAVLHADLAAFDSDARGAWLERFQAIEGLRDFHHGGSALLVVELPFVFLFLALIWQFAGTLVLVPLVMIAVFLLFSYIAGRALRRAIGTKADHHERRLNFIIECLRGIHTVKALALEAQMQRRYERLQRSSAVAVHEFVWVNALIQGLATTFSQAVMVAFVAIGSLNVIEGSLTIGALAAGTMLAGRVLQPALRALAFWTQREGMADREQKLRELLNLPPEAADGRHDPGRLQGRIDLEGVSFRYPGAATPLLSGIDLTVEAGSSVSISGPNGAGKSTLLNLIMGFVVPDEGRILLDGADIAQLDRARVRPQIALIPQEGVLFTGDMLENMTLGRSGNALDDAMRLCSELGLDATLRSLPSGLDTTINGDVAHSMAQGFAQRLVTVRALIGTPSIVLFDDANTGLDDDNDRRLRDLLVALSRRHTLIVISHRPSLQRICQQHYELRDGHLLPQTGPQSGPRQDPSRLRLLRNLAAPA